MNVVEKSPPLKDSDRSTGPDNLQALFREARHRRRRRRAWTATVIAVALSVAGAAFGSSRHDAAGPPSHSTHGVGSAKTATDPGPGHQGSSADVYGPAVQSVGLADDAVGWAASATGLYLTSDDGQSWRTITPPNIAHDFVSAHISALDAIGQNDLWLVIANVPGLVPWAKSTDGSDRGEGIDRSTDGGRTWTLETLPGCQEGCGTNLSVSFVDPEHGFAMYGPVQSGPTQLFATDDGGAAWVQRGELPDLGGISAGGPVPGAETVFSSLVDGWAVTGPTFDSNGQSTSLGGALYRTTDGGVSWSLVSGLPLNNDYELPTFFDAQSGVMVSNPGIPSAQRPPSVYVTDNGGATWSSHPLPLAIAFLASLKGGSIGSRFAAISPESWNVDVGAALYGTTNAGVTWTRSVPTPRANPGVVFGLVFSSVSDGMAISQPPGCSVPVYPS